MVRPKRAGAAALAARWGGLPWGAPSTSWQPSLIEETEFGSNPGDLRMLSFVPRKARTGAPLVVALHGCGQTAASYDHGIGWSRLAERLGFALLLPEQKRSNNFNRCFGWFCLGDMERDAGEPLSIRQMIARMVSDHRLDPARIFITGLSAGGVMTCTMLATYPDVFAGGAIVAGMPYKSAYGRMDALSAMIHGRVRPAAIWAGLVRTASPHRGNWPRVSVWHGTEDRTVSPVNGAEVVKQWVGVHRAARMPVSVDRVNGHRRRAWLNKAGVAVVEEYVVDGMAHGTPVRSGNKQRPVMTAPYVFDMGIEYAEHVAWFWGLAKRRPGRWTKRKPSEQGVSMLRRSKKITSAELTWLFPYKKCE